MKNHYKRSLHFQQDYHFLYFRCFIYMLFELDYQENIDKKLMYYHNIVEGSIK